MSSCGFSKLPRFLNPGAKIHRPTDWPGFPRVAGENSSPDRLAQIFPSCVFGSMSLVGLNCLLFGVCQFGSSSILAR
jgi:hypothetical protein